MAQKLNVKRIVDGQEQLVTVEVLRSWSESGGRHIFLHMGGFYGYKNGDPVRSVKELDVIPPGAHMTAAISWWNRKGKKQSEEFYANAEEQDRILAGDFTQEDALDNADLDNVLYARYSSIDKRPETLEPSPWPEFFKDRPDWWGQANIISFNDWVYERYDSDEKPEEPAPEPDKKENTPAQEAKDSTIDPPDDTQPTDNDKDNASADEPVSQSGVENKGF